MTLPRGKSLLIGLTGGIASGKTEVARFLKSLGAAVISGDDLGRWVMDNTAEMREWVRLNFGKDYFDNNDELKRKKLGDLVFANPELKRKLDEKIFPLIYQKLQNEIWEKSKNNKILVVDAAMIFEWGIEDDFDLLLTVTSDQKKIYRRLSQRDGFNRVQMETRIASQISSNEKAARSHWIIRNDDSLEELEKAVIQFWKEAVVPRIETD